MVIEHAENVTRQAVGAWIETKIPEYKNASRNVTIGHHRGFYTVFVTWGS